MIKKILHSICFFVAGTLWVILLGFIFRLVFMLIYHIDIFSFHTYKVFSNYWNSGGVLRQNDFIMLLILILYIPLCFTGWYFLSHFKYMKLLTVPLNWFANLGSSKYTVKNVNIKNLKVEEKKTIEQVVQERLVAEKKKAQNLADSRNFREKIIEKINEGKN